MLDYTPESSLTTQLCQPETLNAAWRNVRANKGGPGSDGVTIQQFEANLARHLRQLSRELAEERYYPLRIRKFTIKKANGTTRELAVLTLKDRIVQRAISDLISPIYEAKFLDCSFAYRPNRGVPHAIAQVAATRAEGYEWVVHADIEKFFDRMDSQILMRFLRATLKEASILWLIQMWLDMGGITQPPKGAGWYAHLENTVQTLGEGVEQVMNRLLQRTPELPTPATSIYSEDVYDEMQNAASHEEWLVDPSDIAGKNGLWAEAGKEALVNIGREGFMLLLANAKRLWLPLTTKQLFVIVPLAVAALAAPTVGDIVKDHLNRPRKIGIVQGSPLSPLLANIYLHSFDKAMTRAGIRIVRYADDLLLLCRTQRRAHHALEQAQKHLAKLKLTLNPKKTQITHFDTGVEFLGHIFDKDGCYQPIPEPRAKILQNQVQRALKTGAGHVKRSGQHVAQQGKNVAAHIGQRLKNGKTCNTSRR